MEYTKEMAEKEIKQLEEDLILVNHPITKKAIEYYMNQRLLFLSSLELEEVLAKKEENEI